MKYSAPKWLLNSMVYDNPIDITVVGAGGTGSEVLSRLFKMHHLLCKLGGKGLRVTLVDDDIVTASNIGRQSFFEFDINRPKSAAIIERFNSYSSVNWSYAIARVDRSNLLEFVRKDQFLITCVDNPAARVEIGQALESCMDSGVLWIDAGNDASTAQVILGSYEHRRNAPYARLPSVYDLFHEQLKTMPFKAEDSCSHEAAIAKQDFGINDAAAQVIGQLVWQLIRHGEITHHGANIDLLGFSQEPFAIDPELWSMFGYVETKESR